MKHVFVECPKTKALWVPLVQWLRPEIDIDYLTLKEIVFGYFQNHKHSACINILILLTKKYIYSRKCLKRILDFTDLIEYFAFYFKLEKTFNNPLVKNRALDKWHPIADKLNNSG